MVEVEALHFARRARKAGSGEHDASRRRKRGRDPLRAAPLASAGGRRRRVARAVRYRPAAQAQRDAIGGEALRGRVDRHAPALDARRADQIEHRSVVGLGVGREQEALRRGGRDDAVGRALAGHRDVAAPGDAASTREPHRLDVPRRELDREARPGGRQQRAVLVLALVADVTIGRQLLEAHALERRVGRAVGRRGGGRRSVEGALDEAQRDRLAVELLAALHLDVHAARPSGRRSTAPARRRAGRSPCCPSPGAPRAHGVVRAVAARARRREIERVELGVLEDLEPHRAGRRCGSRGPARRTRWTRPRRRSAPSAVCAS